MKAEEMVWEEPPARRDPNRRYDGIIQALKKRPGEWARVAVFLDSGKASSMAQVLRVKRGEHLEACSQRIDQHTVGVWARVKASSNGAS